MDLKYLYTDTGGRIGRKAWWLGALGLFVISFIVNIVLGVVAAASGLSGTVFGVGLMTLVSIGVLFWPYYALTVKRLCDRGRPAILFWVFIGPALASAVLMMFGITGKMANVEIFGQQAPVFEPNMIGKAISAIAFGVGLWALVELGVLGSRRSGGDSHAPDPLASRDA